VQEVDPEDERVMAAFNKPQATERRSLADIIMEKIKEKEQQLELVPKAMPGGAPGTLQILKTRSQTSCAKIQLVATNNIIITLYMA
jgi:hypothetical protein